jgi:hypothetical protein
LVKFSAFLRHALPRAIVLVVAVAACLIAGCSEKKPATAPSLAPIVRPMPNISPAVWDARGTLVNDEPLDVQPEVEAQMGQGRRALYRSVSGMSGAGTEVSGTFYLPKGTPPPGGWPVLSLAHGSTGLNTECAPSSEPDLRGFGASVAGILASGTAVAFTDYEGLGGPGLHPYLEPRTAGFNVIDAVRALRALYPDVSTRWLALGNSQGGQAVWAANELSKFYGAGLDLIGSAAIAPAANLSAMAELAFQQALSPSQRVIMPALVTGVQRTVPAVPIDHFLHGGALQTRHEVIGCAPDADKYRGKITSADVKPTSREDAEALADSLRRMALPQGPLSAPMLVLTGSDDELILPSWVSESVARSCRLGGDIQFRVIQGATHNNIGPDEQANAWMADRFANKPASTNCPDPS